MRPLFVILLSLNLTQFAAGVDIRAFAEPYREINLASSEMGTLAYLNVKEGQHVVAGQLLGGLDEKVLRATLDLANKAREAAGRLESAQAEFDLQSESLAKLTLLHDRGHASAEERSRAEAQKAISLAQLKGVREDMELKAAECARVEAQLQQRRIYSPIDGVVTHVYKDVGEFLSASEPTVLKVVQLDRLLVEFPIPAGSKTKFVVGESITVRVGNERVEAQGSIEFVSPVTDAQSNTIRVKVQIDNQDNRFRGGDSCWLNVELSMQNTDSTPEPGRLITTKPKKPSESR